MQIFKTWLRPRVDNEEETDQIFMQLKVEGLMENKEGDLSWKEEEIKDENDANQKSTPWDLKIHLLVSCK